MPLYTGQNEVIITMFIFQCVVGSFGLGDGPVIHEAFLESLHSLSGVRGDGVHGRVIAFPSHNNK